jgi:hypothetical protein
MQRLKDWYSHPEYYEAIFGTDTERELDFLLGIHARHGNGGKRWLEPACGAGRLLEAGAQRGLQLWGYDVSPQMLAHAKARLTPALARRVRLKRERMETFCPPALQGKIDLAFNLVSTFRYLDSDAAALAHLVATRRLLAPGGLYALGFHLTDYARAEVEEERWVGTAKGARVVCHTREGVPDRRRRSAPMSNRLRVKGPDTDLLIETGWDFRTWSAAQARSLFRRAGLRILVRHDFDYRLDRPAPANRLDSIFVLAPH